MGQIFRVILIINCFLNAAFDHNEYASQRQDWIRITDRPASELVPLVERYLRRRNNSIYFMEELIPFIGRQIASGQIPCDLIEIAEEETRKRTYLYPVKQYVQFMIELSYFLNSFVRQISSANQGYRRGRFDKEQLSFTLQMIADSMSHVLFDFFNIIPKNPEYSTICWTAVFGTAKFLTSYSSDDREADFVDLSGLVNSPSLDNFFRLEEVIIGPSIDMRIALKLGLCEAKSLMQTGHIYKLIRQCMLCREYCENFEEYVYQAYSKYETDKSIFHYSINISDVVTDRIFNYERELAYYQETLDRISFCRAVSRNINQILTGTELD